MSESPVVETPVSANTENETENIGDSILLTVRKLVGGGANHDDFDPDLILHINSVLSILQQLGVGPENGFFIEDDTATWTDYLGPDSADLNMVKSYLCAKVRVLFDPPVSSAVADSLNRIIAEFEWRSNVAAENKQLEEVSGT